MSRSTSSSRPAGSVRHRSRPHISAIDDTPIAPPEDGDDSDIQSETAESAAADAYTVGYRRPPRQTQFKKGQSGNPRGRKQDCKNLKTIFQKVFFEPVKVKENGKSRRMPAIEACAMNLRTQALKGDPKALDRCIRLLTMVERVTSAVDDTGQEPNQMADDKALLEELQRMLLSDQANGVSLTIDDEHQNNGDDHE